MIHNLFAIPTSLALVFVVLLVFFEAIVVVVVVVVVLLLGEIGEIEKVGWRILDDNDLDCTRKI